MATKRERIRLEGRPGPYFERQRAFIEHVLPSAKGSAVRVWTALQGFAGRDRGADTDGIVWPGIQKIATTIGGTVATVYAGIEALEDAGVLRTVEEGTPRRSARRQLLVHPDHKAGFQESEPCLSKNGIQGSENRNSRILKTETEPTSTTDRSETTTPTSTAPGRGGSLRSSDGGGGNGEAGVSFKTREERRRPAPVAPRAQLGMTSDQVDYAVQLHDRLIHFVGEPRARKTRDELRRLIEDSVAARGGDTVQDIIDLCRFREENGGAKIGPGLALKVLRGETALKLPPSLRDEDEDAGDDDDTNPSYWIDLGYPTESAEGMTQWRGVDHDGEPFE